MEKLPSRKRMLIIRASALGDVAMTLPVIYALARQYPDLDVTVLTKPFFQRMFISAPANVSFIDADYAGRHKGPLGIIRLLRELRKGRFDYVADFHNVLRSWVIDRYMRLLGKKVAMVDKFREDRRRLLKGMPSASPDFIDRYAMTLERLGFPVKLDFTTLFPDGAELDAEIRQPAVGVAPFARYYNKTYPLDMMEEVVKILASKGINIYLYGSKAEGETLAKWEAKYPSVTSLAGKYALEQELALMSAMQVMLSMDSANQHLASLAGTKTLTIWGSTTPACGFMPYRQDRETSSIVADLNCQPCTIAGSPECRAGDLKCMRSIMPEKVAKRVLDMLH